MGYQIYQINGRDCGYGVPTVCEQPGCDEEIDRGLAYVCGGTPDGEYGCSLYFCEKHLHYAQTKDGETVQACDRCTYNIEEGDGGPDRYQQPYPEKPDALKWVIWKLEHSSWEQWRKENPIKVSELNVRIGATNAAEYTKIMKELEGDGLYE